MKLSVSKPPIMVKVEEESLRLWSWKDFINSHGKNASHMHFKVREINDFMTTIPWILKRSTFGHDAVPQAMAEIACKYEKIRSAD